MRLWRALAVIGWPLCLSSAGADESRFPPIVPGIWKVQATRVLPSGEVQKWTRTARYCDDPRRLFEGYWGLAKLQKFGCRYTAAPLSEDGYQITSVCEIEGGRMVTSKSMVTLRSSAEFEMHVELLEGSGSFHASVLGHRIGNCKN